MTAPKHNSTPLMLGIVGVIVLACLGALVWFYFSFTPRGPAGPVLTDAYINSQVYVQSQLKAPATAKFPYSGDASAVKVTDLGGNVAEVTAYVDAQNSFGAMIRTHYTATLQWVSGSDWKVTSFKFLDATE